MEERCAKTTREYSEIHHVYFKLAMSLEANNKKIRHLVAKRRVSAGNSDHGNVVKATCVGNRGRRKVSSQWVRNNHGVHLAYKLVFSYEITCFILKYPFGDQVFAHVERRTNRVGVHLNCFRFVRVAPHHILAVKIQMLQKSKWSTQKRRI
jgi:hypothetical protein